MARNEHLDFLTLKIRCNGMLGENSYRMIYEAASNSPDGLLVEVGTAHGAATIAMALGARRAGKNQRVHTFDRLQGGSRARFGSVEQNLRVVRENFQAFGVADQIELHVGDVNASYSAWSLTGPIGMLVLDADGRIDRDIGFFYEALSPGALIVIDDCADTAKLKKQGGRTVSVDLKHKLTFELVRLFENHGVIEIHHRDGQTVFARKPETAPELVDFNQMDIVGAYANALFCSGQLPGFRDRVKYGTYLLLQKYSPTTLELLYRLKARGRRFVAGRLSG